MRSIGPWQLATVLFAACKPTTVDVRPDLTVSPELLDFGAVGVDGEATLPVTLANAGGGSVSLLSMTLTDGDADVWTIDRNGVETIGSESQATVLVTFSPEDEEPYSGQIQIRTDFTEQQSFYVSLAGIGGLSVEDYDGDGFSVAEGDCDDGNGEVNPGADEACNGYDDNCDGEQLDGERDEDGDGWQVCAGDCDDQQGAVNPGQSEICDGLDNDCDPDSGENDDDDGDSFTTCTGDCDDDEAEANPAEAEVCDGLDNNCDGGIDDIDLDGDGHTVCSGGGDCDDTDVNAYPVVVSTSGSGSGDGTDASPYDTLANAIPNLDNVCRTVVMEPGTYNDVDIDWSSGDVSVVGRSGNPEDVELVAIANDRHFTVTGGFLELRDLSLINGNAPDDGGSIQVINAAVELDGVIFDTNTSANDGGAVAAVSSELTLRRGCVFDDNIAADDGGAMYLDGSTVDDQGTLYEENTGIRGGALFIQGGDVEIDDAELLDNAAATEGGAIAVNGVGQYQIERSRFARNDAGVDGGAIALRDVNDPTSNLRNNQVQDNVAQAGGGGIAILGSTGALRVANNTVTGNLAVGGEGGGILVEVSSGSGIQLLGNVLHSNDGASALFVVPGAGSFVAYNTAYLTNSGFDFAGEAGDGAGGPLDTVTNASRDPLLAAFSDDGDPDNDDLTLQGGSPEIDSGPESGEFNDDDGSRNDRGYTGGPAAP